MKHYLRFMLVLLLSTVWCVGGYSQEKTLSVDFESRLSTYTDWTFSNITKANTITAKTGSYYGNTTGRETASIQTKNIIESPGKLKFYISKESTNTNATSKWIIQVSSDATKWIDIKTQFAASVITKGKWTEVSQDLSSQKNVYVRIYYKGTTAKRCIDDITLTYTSSTSKKPTTTTFGPGVDDQTITVTEGETFPTHVATTTAGVTGNIAYVSDNAAVKVDQNGVTSAGTGFGKAKITATFTPTDADTYASSSACYYIDYKEKTKPATAISFGKQNVTLTTLDYASFTGQTAKLMAGETILTNELTYSKEDADGVITTLNNNDGTLVLSGKTGTATVTATFAGNDEYASSTASYTITVVDPNKLEVTFDFTKPDLYGYDVPASGSGTSLEEGNTINSGVVTITNVKSGGTDKYTNKCVFHNTKNEGITLRFYTNAEATVSVPTGYAINKIEFVTDNTSDQITITPELYNSEKSTWTGSANSVSLMFKSTVKFTSMTVTYAKVKTPTVTFNEEEANDDALLNNENKTVNVTMKRTIGTGYLNPVCFPFAMGATQITEVFGEGSKVSSMSMDMPDGNLHFDYVETMEAGMPYLVEPTKASTTIEVKNVKISKLSGEKSEAIDNNSIVYTFQGTFEPYAFKTNDGTELFLGKDNTLYMPQRAGQMMKGFRAYFTTDAKTNEFPKVVVNGQTTTISSLMSGKTMTGKVYNLNGQYVGTSLEGLAKGVYVMNGQKFVVK